MKRGFSDFICMCNDLYNRTNVPYNYMPHRPYRLPDKSISGLQLLCQYSPAWLPHCTCSEGCPLLQNTNQTKHLDRKLVWLKTLSCSVSYRRNEINTSMYMHNCIKDKYHLSGKSFQTVSHYLQKSYYQ